MKTFAFLHNPANPAHLHQAVASLVLATALAAPVAASDAVYKLFFVAYPEIPGWSVRHVQVIGTDQAVREGTETYVLGQYVLDLSIADVGAIEKALTAWVDGQAPRNPPMLWKKWTYGTGAWSALEFTERTTPDRYLLITASTWVGITQGRPGQQQVGMGSYSKLRWQLSEEEAGDLATALEAWLSGWNGDEGYLWSRMEQN